MFFNDLVDNVNGERGFTGLRSCLVTRISAMVPVKRYSVELCDCTKTLQNLTECHCARHTDLQILNS